MFGIVMASDSLPVTLHAQGWEIPPHGNRTRDPILPVDASGFVGFAGFVGTEVIAGVPAREWLRGALRRHSSGSLATVCEGLAGDLTSVWEAQPVATHLSVFVAGNDAGLPAFWYVSNGDVPTGSATSLPTRFEAVNDLGGKHAATKATPSETIGAWVARVPPTFRRGVLSAADIFDRFGDLVAQVIAEPEHSQVPPFDTLDRFARYVMFRFEFTKRLYDPKKGIGVPERPAPVQGRIHVYSVDPAGVRLQYGKNATQVRSVRGSPRSSATRGT
jgi:hypothetical protein